VSRGASSWSWREPAWRCGPRSCAPPPGSSRPAPAGSGCWARTPPPCPAPPARRWRRGWATCRYHRRLALSEARRQGALAAARFGLAWPLPAALPAEVPPGVHRRVALARAVVLSPELLLLEGFTDDLSRPDAAALCAAVREWARERGAALLAATDDPSLAGRLGARRQLLEA